MLVDSHCHLNYLDDPNGALARARQAQVSGCLCIGVEHKTIRQVLDFAAAHRDVWASVGEHPGSCSGDASWVSGYLSERRVVAVGEMGLDYHYEKQVDAQSAQRHTFAQQMAMAEQHDLPVIIHTRDAIADTLSIMADFPSVRGVLHCFTETRQMAEQAVAMGYYISISGIVTFRNADNVREVAMHVPADRLLVETDAPWLAPVPHRGQQNEPGFVQHTAQYLAELRGVSFAQLAEQTSANFYQLFTAATCAEKSPESD
ncbi:MAG: TatD family hydrolase [Pseudomonadota bacterium]